MRWLFAALTCGLAACSELAAERVFPTDPADGGVAPVTDASTEASVTLQGPCPVDMAYLGQSCIDRYEAYVVEVDNVGVEHEHSPFARVEGLRVRAKGAAQAIPQGYISQLEASAACKEAGKRLCSKGEFERACRGKDGQRTYPYGGVTRKPGACNEGKGSSVARLFGADPATWTYANFNDPRLNQLSNTLAPSGSYPECDTDEGVYDLVGNLHEWGDDSADAKGHGRFRGGFYGDAEVNGQGCLYVTSAHELSYHDYSTGFRCCKDAAEP